MIQSITETALAVSVEEAKDYGRITTNDEDVLVASLVRMAQAQVEDYTGRAAGVGTFKYVAPAWPVRGWDQFYLFPAFRPSGPKDITLGRSPLVSVQSVKYLAPGAVALSTVDPVNYTLDTVGLPGRVVFRNDYTLPDLDTDCARTDVVQIEFTAGVVNPQINLAILLTFVNYYENRTPVVTGTIATELPRSVQNLLRSQRI